MTWKALLLLALVLSPAAVALSVAVNAHFVKPMDSLASPVSGEPPALLDPIDTDVPGGVSSLTLRGNAAQLST